MVGTQLGRYRILKEIGSGGMGVVYRAHDERLDRTVAIKVLPTGSLADEVARRRFQKEALALSKLNHPNIAILYDFENQAGADLLVMEEVAGVSMETRLASSALTQAEVILLGKQLAEALQAAHQAGILHRDLKPGNLRLTQDGRLKVLDFGLASSLHPISVSKSTASISDYGPTAGTLAYMAPEQLSGDEPDLRSDIYSAGTVLFEMATGHHPFENKSTPALVADVLRKPAPSARTLQPELSPELERIIGTCLEKNPDDRYQSARELAVDLRQLEFSSAAVNVATPRRKRRTLLWIAAGVVALLAFATFEIPLLFRATRQMPSPARYVQITNFADSAVWPALSPDGRMLAFIRGENTSFSGLTSGQVYVKFLPDGEPVRLTDDSRAKMNPRFSPDGSQVAYTVRESSYDTWTVTVLGGKSPRLWMANASGLTWLDVEGTQPRLLYSEMTGQSAQMGIVSSTESRTQHGVIYMPPENGMAHRSYASPDGKQVLLVEMDESNWLPCRLVPFDGSSSGKPVGPPQSQCFDATWSPDGEWMYFSADTGRGLHIWRQHVPNGNAEQVTFGTTEESGVSFAPDGKSFFSSIGGSQSTIWLHDSKGDRQITSEGFAVLPSLSSDNKKLYYLVGKPGSQPGQPPIGTLWVADLESGERQRLFRDFQIRHYDISADGQRVLFTTGDEHGRSPWLAKLDGRSEPRRLAPLEASTAYFAAQGQIVFNAESGERAIYRVREDGAGLQKITTTPVPGITAVSPDGQWAAVLGGTDQSLTAIMLYPLAGGPLRILCRNCFLLGSTGAGRAPVASWSPDGRFLYLQIDRAMFAVPLRRGQMLPPIPERGFQSKEQVLALPGTKQFPEEQVFVGSDPSVYAHTRAATQRNIYRIPVP
jgi:serine/threonine protein kinase